MMLKTLRWRVTLQKVLEEAFALTMHSENVTGLDPMAWRLSLSTLDEGWQTGSPLVPYKLSRLLPHKGRVPGRSRDSPSWTQLLTVQQLATRQGGDWKKSGALFPGSVCPLLEYEWWGSTLQIQITPVCLFLSCINGTWLLQWSKKTFHRNLGGEKTINSDSLKSKRSNSTTQH